MIPKITLDGGLRRERALLPSVEKLVAWEAEGKIEIHESDRAKPTTGESDGNSWPGAAPTPKRRGYRTVSRPGPGGITFQKLSAVLFPQRDPTRLNITEVNDVAHLMRHHALGHNMFVTTNARDFIDAGKRERLLSAFQIVVVTPDEAVDALKASVTA